MLTEQEKQAELERVTRISGFRFGLHDFWAEVAPDELKERNDRWEATHEGGAILDRKTEEFIRIAVYVAMLNTTPSIQIHVHAARKYGATPEEIMEVITKAARYSAIGKRIAGLEAWRLVFRPELPPISRVVELR